MRRRVAFNFVAAAPIVAKCTRDQAILAMCDAEEHLAVRYGWKTNMGYPTATHLGALKTFGPSVHHRRSFAVTAR